MKFLLKISFYPCLFFIIGFIFFWGFLPHDNNIVPAQVQGIVVFTGGAGRVEAALNLLESNFRTPMLITGVHPMVNLEQLLQGRKIDGEKLMNLTLDHTALTTRQNVAAVQEWAQQNSVTKIALVTSNYHMPRSRILFWLYAPKLQIFPLPVEKYVRLSFLVREYVKLLLAPLLK